MASKGRIKILVIFMLMHPLNSIYGESDVEYLVSSQTEELKLPFSDVVRVGNMLYLSGQLGNVQGQLKLVDGGIVPETQQLFSNIKSILNNNKSSLDKIVKCTVMMADIAEWPKFNKVYVSYFPGNKPARSAFGAKGLALGARVEMECWAMVD